MIINFGSFNYRIERDSWWRAHAHFHLKNGNVNGFHAAMRVARYQISCARECCITNR